MNQVHANDLPPDLLGFVVVHVGEPDRLGRCPVRIYRAPTEQHGKKISIQSFKDDPYENTHPYQLHYETSVDPPTGIITVSKNSARSAIAPPAWGVLGDASRKFGDGMRSLVLFHNDKFIDGTIINEMQFPTLGVDSSTQVAALIWSSKNGLIDQIYVSPEHRRYKTGKKIISFAGAVHHTFGWPGFMHGDGRRTDLGQSFANDVRRQHLVAPHSELSPPMDPQ